MGLSILGKSQVFISQPQEHIGRTEELKVITSVLVERLNLFFNMIY